VGNTCKAFNNSTGFNIPKPFSVLPGLNAVYLTALRTKNRINNGRVSSLEYYGQGEVKSLSNPDYLGPVLGSSTFEGHLFNKEDFDASLTIWKFHLDQWLFRASKKNSK
jgi:hypothetical protein